MRPRDRPCMLPRPNFLTFGRTFSTNVEETPTAHSPLIAVSSLCHDLISHTLPRPVLPLAVPPPETTNGLREASSHMSHSRRQQHLVLHKSAVFLAEQKREEGGQREKSCYIVLLDITQRKPGCSSSHRLSLQTQKTSRRKEKRRHARTSQVHQDTEKDR